MAGIFALAGMVAWAPLPGSISTARADSGDLLGLVSQLCGRTPDRVRFGKGAVSLDEKSLVPNQRFFGPKPEHGFTGAVVTGWSSAAELMKQGGVRKALSEIGRYPDLKAIPEAVQRSLFEKYGISIVDYDASKNRLSLRLTTQEPLGYSPLRTRQPGEQVSAGSRGAGSAILASGESQPTRLLYLVFGEAKPGSKTLGLRTLHVGDLPAPLLPPDLAVKVADLTNAGGSVEAVRGLAKKWFAAHPNAKSPWTSAELESAAAFWRDHALVASTDSFERSVRAPLRAEYGPVINNLSKEELARVKRLGDQVEAMRTNGLLDAEGAQRWHKRIADSLVTPERLARLSGDELAGLYQEMKVSRRFTDTQMHSNAGGLALQDRFLELFGESIRSEHPELTVEIWKRLSREERIAVVEDSGAAKRFAEKYANSDTRMRDVGDHGSVSTRVGDTRIDAKTAAERLEVLKLAEEEHAKRINALDAVAKIRERFETFSKINDADNAHYIAVSDSVDAIEGRLFFEVENAVLKTLNDSVIANKDTVTALNNQYKEILFGNLESNPILRNALTAQYSDFKSLRFLFKHNTPEIMAELEKVYLQSAREFEDELKASPLRELYLKGHGIEKSPASWHLAGVGSTADEASLAARSARPYFKESSPITALRSFEGSEGMLTDRLNALEDIRATLQAQLSKSENKVLVPMEPGEDILNLSEEGFEIMRKLKGGRKGEGKVNSFKEYVQEVKTQFEVSFGVKLTEQQVIMLRDYVTLVDGFSPSIVTPGRVNINMGLAAKNGAMSFDLAGANAGNLAGTAHRLAAAKGSPSLAVVGAREAEKAVTLTMQEKYQVVVESVTDVLKPSKGSWFRNLKEKLLGAPKRIFASGDDIMFFPDRPLTPQERMAIEDGITRRLAKKGIFADRIRTTYQPPKFADGSPIPKGERSTHIVAAEGVEKALRKGLKAAVGLQKSQKVGMMIEYVPGPKGSGQVDIYLSGEASPEVINYVRAHAQEYLPEGSTLHGVLGQFPSSP